MLTSGGEILTRAGNPLRYGSIGNGVKLIGADSSYVNIPHNAVIDFQQTDNFSFYFLFRIRSYIGLNNLLLSKREVVVGGNRGFTINLGGSSFRSIIFALTDGANQKRIATGLNITNTNIMYSLCVVKNTTSASGFKIYLDKIEIPVTVELDNTLTNIKNTLPMLLGQVDNANYTNIDIHKTITFNKALSQAEVNQLSDSYGCNIRGLSTNIVVDLPFQEKTGTTVKDISASNLSVTLVNFVNTALGVNNQHIDKNGNGITV
jgi:hypothetical protein